MNTSGTTIEIPSENISAGRKWEHTEIEVNVTGEWLLDTEWGRYAPIPVFSVYRKDSNTIIKVGLKRLISLHEEGEKDADQTR